MTVAENVPSLIGWIIDLIVEVTGLPARSVRPDATIEDLGIESLAIIGLTSRLQVTYPELAKSFIFDCRTVRDIADFLADRFPAETRARMALPSGPDVPIVEPVGRLEPAERDEDWPEIPAIGGGATAPVPSIPRSPAIGEPEAARPYDPPGDAVAVIGMHGRFAGADDLQAFWALLENGTDCITQIPSDRWSLDGFFEEGTESRRSGKSYAKWGSFLDDVYAFDAGFFGIAPRDAVLMDPQERLFLECATLALDDAGIAGERLDALRGPSDLGVFVGTTTNTHQLHGPRLWMSGEAGVPTAMPWSSANRVSYALNVSGPSLAVDTACSSSLVAIHLAIESLRAGECRAAIAGGVNLYLHPSKYVQLCQYQMLSPTGRCHAFGADADGFVPGEGVGAVVLKPLSAARADGDRIIGVLRGSAVNHSGHTNGYTVPNARSQVALIERALAHSALAPEAISYLEAHGTGTKLGDPIEMSAIATALGRDGDPCLVGSLKSNIGHLEGAAGVAGLIKVLLQLEHGYVAPSLHAARLNPDLRLQGSRFELVREKKPWLRGSAGAPRRAGVSSFGAGGTCAHVIVEEAPVHGAIGQGPLVFPFSAPTKEQLRRVVSQVRDLVAQPLADENDRLLRLAFTLQCCRRSFSHRFVASADSRSELLECLDGFLEGRVLVARRHTTSRELATKWGEGDDVAWLPLWTQRPVPLSLPAFPFERELHSIIARSGEPATPTNIANDRHDYALDRADPVLDQHRIEGVPILPGTGYLDLVARSIGVQPVRLKDVRWLSPCRCEGPSLGLSVTCDRSVQRIAIERTDLEANVTCFSAELVDRGPTPTLESRAAIDSRCRRREDAAVLYSAVEAAGLQYGTKYRRLTEVRVGDGEMIGRVVTESDASIPDGSILDPGLLDAAFQACFFLGDVKGTTFVPARVRALEIRGPLPSVFYVHARATVADAASNTFDLTLYGENGDYVGAFIGLTFAALARTDRSGDPRLARDISLFTSDWRPITNDEMAAPVNAALLVSNDLRFAEACARRGIAGLHALSRPMTDFRIEGGSVSFDLRSDLHIDYLLRATDLSADLVRVVLDLRHGRESNADRLEAIRDHLALLKRLTDLERPLRLVTLHHDQSEARGVTAMLRSIRMEGARLAAVAIAVDDTVDPANLVSTISTVLSRSSDDIVTMGSGPAGDRMLAYRSLSVDATAIEPIASAEDVVVLTGGTGAIGAVLAEAMAESGATIALLGRSPRDRRIEQQLAGLARRGAHFAYWQADCRDRDAVETALGGIRRRFGPPTMIVHSAGVLKDGRFAAHRDDAWIDVVAAKVEGAINLDHATRDDRLRAFVVMSALAGVTGNHGQTLYALANGWLDGFATRRQDQVDAGQRSGRTQAIAWPLWAEGMQGTPRLKVAMAQAGFVELHADEGLSAFRAAAQTSAADIVVVKGDRAAAARLLGADREGGVPKVPSTQPERAPQTRPLAAPANEHAESALLDFLREALAAVTGGQEAKIDPDTALDAFGLDSILALDMSRRIEERFPSLSKTFMFEARSLRAMARLLAAEHPDDVVRFVGTPEKHVAPDVVVEATPHKPAVSVRTGAAPIAIVGVAGRYPGADNLADFWEILRDGRDMITEVPEHLRSRDLGVYAKWGSFIRDSDAFDPLFFGISPRDAERMDPQERVFLETAWHAVEDAGHTPESLAGGVRDGVPRRRVAVVAGVMYGEYQFYGAERALDQTLTNSSYASIANRVSFCLNFDGPSFAVDSMCSSALTSIHLACDLLRSGSCDVALAGGVNLSTHPYKYRVLSELKFASTDGRCRSFGEGGDGYVPGEGCGILVLRPLEEAIAEGDHIYATIRGSDIGHGARSSGYTVPNPDAQASVIRRAFERSGIDPVRLSYVEAHGTGTSLGDPIEIRGLTKALGDRIPQGHVCAIGSLKANIGHLESAAGVAGVTKVLLQMKHRMLAPSIHSGTLNPFIDFSKLPFKVQRDLAEWPADPEPRVAAVSSFGAGGSNAHIVIEESPAIRRAAPDGARTVELLMLSSGSRSQLAATARRLAAHLERDPADLHDVAMTLKHGRRQHDVRLAIVTDSLAAFCSALTTVADLPVETASLPPGVYVTGGLGVERADAIELCRLAAAWVEGQERVSDEDAPRSWSRVPLVGYEFKRRRFWPPAAAVVESLNDNISARDNRGLPDSTPVPKVLRPAEILDLVRAGTMSPDDARRMLESLRTDRSPILAQGAGRS